MKIDNIMKDDNFNLLKWVTSILPIQKNEMPDEKVSYDSSSD
jgi:hypothetical protein